MLFIAIILIFCSIFGIVYSSLTREKEQVISLKMKSGKFPRPFLVWLARLNSKINTKWIQKKRKKLQSRISKTGETWNFVPDEFFALQEIAGIFLSLFGCTISGRVNFFTVVILFVFGFFFPEILLRDKIKKREKILMRSLPDALDLLTLSVEAGLDFTASIGKVVQKSKAGPLSEEFSQFLNELKIGKTRKEALEDMTERIGIFDFSSFTSALIQADEMGISLGPVLRIQSDELCNKRILAAEKLAVEAPVKILLPLIAFIFPAVFIIVFGPIILTGIF